MYKKQSGKGLAFLAQPGRDMTAMRGIMEQDSRTRRRMELTRLIREENHMNRRQVRAREDILYGFKRMLNILQESGGKNREIEERIKSIYNDCWAMYKEYLGDHNM